MGERSGAAVMHRSMRVVSAAIATGLVLSACMTAPTGPSIFALPGRDKTLEQFTAADGRCRQYATERVGALAQDSALDMQRRYDTAYIQCMYAAGHRVPVAGVFTSPPPGSPRPPPPPPPPPGSPAPADGFAPPVPYVPPPAPPAPAPGAPARN